MSTIAVSEPRVKSARKGLLWIVPLAVLVVVFAGWGLKVLNWRTASTGFVNAKYHRIVPMTLDVKVVKDGELQAINNIEIVNLVEGQTTIQTLVKEGTYVRKGDVLATLDSSDIRQRIEDTELQVQRAEADYATSKEMRDIQENQNAADLESATVQLALAELELKAYLEGTYKQQVANATTEKRMAEINLQNKLEELQQTRNLFSKGFVTAADLKKSELDVMNAENTLAKANTALEVLTKYTHEMEMKIKESAVTQAKRRLARVIRNNASQMAQREADLKAKEQSLATQRRRLEHFKQQLEYCTIRAPADGMVVHVMANRWSDTPLQEGTQVRERQTLLRLPDTSSMKTVVLIQESQVSRLQVGQRATVKIVGVPYPVGASVSRIAVMADTSQRWWNPDLRQYPVDLTLDETPPNLKPGMSAQAEIFIDRAENVLAVPLEAIYTTGKDSYVFVRQSANEPPRTTKVVLGRTNETHAEIVEGVNVGDEVLLLQAGQGRELAEKSGVRIEPTTRPSDQNAPPAENRPPASPPPAAA